MYLQSFDFGRELLKWIAIITMTVDHVGAILYPEFTVLRFIGRLSFPLFAYLLILGMENTRNIRNYFT
ncbi:MAG: conjugal transfer protein TraX, partial [Candidatus Bathyarchaeota archaeon]|nr:conjugal transfer protein TraX [Candidatus Bathyarchaeota archaeon]